MANNSNTQRWVNQQDLTGQCSGMSGGLDSMGRPNFDVSGISSISSGGNCQRPPPPRGCGFDLNTSGGIGAEKPPSLNMTGSSSCSRSAVGGNSQGNLGRTCSRAASPGPGAVVPCSRSQSPVQTGRNPPVVRLNVSGLIQLQNIGAPQQGGSPGRAYVNLQPTFNEPRAPCSGGGVDFQTFNGSGLSGMGPPGSCGGSSFGTPDPCNLVRPPQPPLPPLIPARPLAEVLQSYNSPQSPQFQTPPRPNVLCGENLNTSNASGGGLSSCGPPSSINSSGCSSPSYMAPKSTNLCGDRLPQYNNSGPCPLTSQSPPPQFNLSGLSSCSSGCPGQSPCSRQSSPGPCQRQQSSGPCPRQSATGQSSQQQPSAPCSRQASRTPSSTNLDNTGKSSGSLGARSVASASKLNTPPPCARSQQGQLNSTGGSGLSNIQPPDFGSSFGSYNSGESRSRSNTLDQTGLSGVSGLSAISKPQNMTGSSCSRSNTLDQTGLSGVSGLSDVSRPQNMSSSCSRSNTLDQTGLSGVSGLSDVSKPQNLSSSCSRSNTLDQTGLSGVSGLSGISKPQDMTCSSCGSCGRNTLDTTGLSGASGLSGIPKPQELSYQSGTGSRYPSPVRPPSAPASPSKGCMQSYNSSGIMGMGDSPFASSNSGYSGCNSGCSRPATAPSPGSNYNPPGSYYAPPASPFGNMSPCSRSSGLEGIRQPNLNDSIASSIRTPSLNISGGSGLDSFFIPDLNSSCGSYGPMNSTVDPQSPNLMQFSPYRSPPNMMQFTPDASPNLMQFSPDSSFGAQPGGCGAPGGACRRVLQSPQPADLVPDLDAVSSLVSEAQQFLMNMTAASIGGRSFVSNPPSPGCPRAPR